MQIRGSYAASRARRRPSQDTVRSVPSGKTLAVPQPTARRPSSPSSQLLLALGLAPVLAWWGEGPTVDSPSPRVRGQSRDVPLAWTCARRCCHSRHHCQTAGSAVGRSKRHRHVRCRQSHRWPTSRENTNDRVRVEKSCLLPIMFTTLIQCSTEQTLEDNHAAHSASRWPGSICSAGCRVCGPHGVPPRGRDGSEGSWRSSASQSVPTAARGRARGGATFASCRRWSSAHAWTSGWQTGGTSSTSRRVRALRRPRRATVFARRGAADWPGQRARLGVPDVP